MSLARLLRLMPHQSYRLCFVVYEGEEPTAFERRAGDSVFFILAPFTTYGFRIKRIVWSSNKDEYSCGAFLL